MKTKLSMNKYLIFSLFVVIITGACTPQPQDVSTEIQKANDAFMSAVKNRDVEAITGMYTADALVLPANQPIVEGSKSIHHMWEQSFKYGMGYLDISTSEAEALGNFAHEVGTYEYFTPDNQMVDKGKYIVVWQKEGNQWKIAKDIWNSTMPMPPRAAVKDTVAIVITKVQPDKYEQLTTFAHDIFYPAFEKHFPDSKAASHMYKIINKPDGEVELIYFIDPLKPNQVHNVKTILSRHYNAEDTDKYLEEFRSYIIEQEVINAVALGW